MAKQHRLSQEWSISSVYTLDAPSIVGVVYR